MRAPPISVLQTVGSMTARRKLKDNYLLYHDYNLPDFASDKASCAWQIFWTIPAFDIARMRVLRELPSKAIMGGNATRHESEVKEEDEETSNGMTLLTRGLFTEGH